MLLISECKTLLIIMLITYVPPTQYSCLAQSDVAVSVYPLSGKMNSAHIIR